MGFQTGQDSHGRGVSVGLVALPADVPGKAAFELKLKGGRASEDGSCAHSHGTARVTGFETTEKRKEKIKSSRALPTQRLSRVTLGLWDTCSRTVP